MDDLVDLELKAVERILEKIDSDPEPDYIKDTERRTWQVLYDAGKKGRRTGLGFTALADALAALGAQAALAAQAAEAARGGGVWTAHVDPDTYVTPGSPGDFLRLKARLLEHVG